LQIHIELSGGPSAAHAARSAVAAFVARVPEPPPQAIVDNLTLLASELVTNSIRHGGVTERGVVHMRLSHRGATFRVEVEDLGPGFEPRTPRARPDRTSGYGLVLVERLSRRWGVEASDSVRVWFEIDAPTGPSPRAERRGEGERILEPA